MLLSHDLIPHQESVKTIAHNGPAVVLDEAL